MAKSLRNIRLRFGVKVILFMTMMFLMVAFVESKQESRVCHDVNISIDRKKDNYFLQEEDVEGLLTRHGKDSVVGGKLIHIDSRDVEKRLKRNSFVEDAEVVKKLDGQLKVNVRQAETIARVIGENSSFYISDKGTVLPLSERFTARVMLITGSGVDEGYGKTSPGSYKDSVLFNMIKHIHNDDFLKSQIAVLEVQEDQNIVLHPQVTKQLILFGSCEQYVEKFEKLRIFYDRILPRKGWNKYDTVNVRFKDQIICY